MTPAERVAVREAQAKLDAILDEPRVSDPVLVDLLDRLVREAQKPGALGVEGAARAVINHWSQRA